MDNQNPYAAPRAELGEGPDEPLVALASRGARLGATMLDGLIVGVIFLPFYFYFLLKYLPQMAARPGGLGIGNSLLFATISTVIIFAIFLVLNIGMMRSRGQTIGKRMAGIRVVGPDGEQASMSAQMKRYSFKFLIKVVPFIGSLIWVIDSLCIFRDSHRCLHDDIANTTVIND